MGHEVWICTDNEVTEIIHHKGYSTDKELSEMKLELTEVSLKQFFLKIAHVDGTQMILSACNECRRVIGWIMFSLYYFFLPGTCIALPCDYTGYK